MSQPLLLIGIALLVFAVFFLFLNGGIAFWFFVIGVGLIVFHYKTPQGKAQWKAELAQAEANKKAAIELGESLKIRFQQFSKNPADIESLEFVLKTLANLNKSSLKKWMRLIVIPLLKLKPLDKSIRDTVFDYAKKTITLRVTATDEASSKEVYDAALEILSQHPEQLALKQYALEVGRWHFTIQRPDHKVTIFDEQSIQNDIAVRSK